MKFLGVEVHRAGAPAPWPEVARLFALLGVDHVIDVGANEGQFAQAIRDYVKFAGRIDCVEPQPAAAAKLRARGDVTVHQLALGDTSGEAVLRLYGDSVLSSIHTLNADAARRAWGSEDVSRVVDTIAVPVTTLDDLLDSVPLGRRLWVKVDTQGHDLPVFRGLRRHLGRVVGAQSELAFCPLYDGVPTASESLTELGSMGFRFAGLHPIGRFDQGVVTEADCFFIRST